MSKKDLSQAVTLADIKNFIGFATVLVTVVFFTAQLQGDVNATKQGVLSINQKLDSYTEKTNSHENRITRLETIVERKSIGISLDSQLAYASAAGMIN